jgi:hypothetical protein
MSAISYIDGELTLSSLSILLPHLPIKSYEPESGKLSLSLQGHQSISTKLLALQTLMLNSTQSNYSAWFPGERERSQEDLSSMFQPLVSHGSLHLYCPISNTNSFNDIHVYSGQGGWSRGTSLSTFVVGKSVRLAVRLQGISFHQHPITKTWTGKSRVQHRILSMYID